ncbi:MAG: hypothetical protein NC250_09280 [Alistipes senegalensis]|nr:hypothetical protein [Bacteroides cellulosilyticus]MCM1352906.1 hypothetical protein [Alistipes senegalensis]
METKPIRQLKKGEFFRLSTGETSPVWVRGEYIRETKKYSTYKYDDVNHERLLAGNHKVVVDFIF